MPDSKARVAGDHKQPADAAQRCDNFLDHAVCEIFLLWVSAHILERQHGNRRIVRLGQHRCPLEGGGLAPRRRARRPWFEVNAEYPDRSRYIFEALLTHVAKCDVESVAYLVAHHAAHADSAWIGESL